jgi:hypothetical protein
MDIPPIWLALWISTMTVMISGFVIFITVVDGRLTAAAHSERLSHARLLETIESLSEGITLYDTDERYWARKIMSSIKK